MGNLLSFYKKIILEGLGEEDEAKNNKLYFNNDDFTSRI